MSKKKLLWVCGLAKGVPLWIYYARYMLVILEGIINMTTLPFGKQIDITTWMVVNILKAGTRRYDKLKR
jgi:hypothetical protein